VEKRGLKFALVFVVIGSVSSAADCLRAADVPCERTVFAEKEPAAEGSSLTVRVDSPAVAPVSELQRQQTANSRPTVASGPVQTAPKALFSHTKWQGPAVSAQAAAEPSEPVLQWKGAFQTGRHPSAKLDPEVTRTSGELPLDAVQPVRLPTPPRANAADRTERPTPAQRQPAGPDIPPQIAQPKEIDPDSLPSLERQLEGQGRLKAEKCLTPHDLKSIREISADIAVRPGDLTGDRQLPPECPFGDSTFQPRHWHKITFSWTAAATSHNPLYFEDEQMERYGNCFGPVTQTTVSAVRFFSTAPLVPYFMGVYPANETIYDLGQYRPGSCAPFYLDPLPLSVRGALYEGTFLGFLPAL
jgi:hypothetical protein